MVINYHRSQAQAEALAAEIGGWAVQADVADPVQVGRMVDNVLDKYCQLDISDMAMPALHSRNCLAI